MRKRARRRVGAADPQRKRAAVFGEELLGVIDLEMYAHWIGEEMRRARRVWLEADDVTQQISWIGRDLFEEDLRIRARGCGGGRRMEAKGLGRHAGPSGRVKIWWRLARPGAPPAA